MKNLPEKEMEKICELYLKLAGDILEKDYQNRWSLQFESLLIETAKALEHRFNVMLRHNPDFEINKDLSNLFEDPFLPGTESIGMEIQKFVRSKFYEFKIQNKK
jgi:hypothetical protein